MATKKLSKKDEWVKKRNNLYKGALPIECMCGHAWKSYMDYVDHRELIHGVPRGEPDTYKK